MIKVFCKSTFALFLVFLHVLFNHKLSAYSEVEWTGVHFIDESKSIKKSASVH